MIMANPVMGQGNPFRQNPSMGRLYIYIYIYIPRWMVDFYGKLVGKCPMDAMGFRNSGNKKPDEFATRQLW